MVLHLHAKGLPTVVSFIETVQCLHGQQRERSNQTTLSSLYSRLPIVDVDRLCDFCDVLVECVCSRVHDQRELRILFFAPFIVIIAGRDGVKLTSTCMAYCRPRVFHKVLQHQFAFPLSTGTRGGMEHCFCIDRGAKEREETTSF